VTSHAPLPQVTFSHACAPEHSAVHDEACEQSMFLQAPSPHVSWHGTPGGHLVVPGQLSFAEQSITHVLP